MWGAQLRLAPWGQGKHFQRMTGADLRGVRVCLTSDSDREA